MTDILLCGVRMNGAHTQYPFPPQLGGENLSIAAGSDLPGNLLIEPVQRLHRYTLRRVPEVHDPKFGGGDDLPARLAADQFLGQLSHLTAVVNHPAHPLDSQRLHRQP